MLHYGLKLLNLLGGGGGGMIGELNCARQCEMFDLFSCVIFYADLTQEIVFELC